MNHRRLVCLIALLAACPNTADAELFGGIEFPDGARSFADQLIRYEPLHQGGPGPTDPRAIGPLEALGPPNYDPVEDTKYVSLGRGGLIELSFLDNVLTNSGDGKADLHIFEIGPDVEDTFVAIRPLAVTLALLPIGGDANGDGFFEIGKVFGSTSSIDIDALFPGHAAGQLQFSAVQLIDDYSEGDSSGVFVGADIDSVGAISSMVPEPASWQLLCLAVITAAAGRALPRRQEMR